MLVAETALRVPLQEEAGLLDIQEEEDAAILSQGAPSSSTVHQLSSSAAAPEAKDSLAAEGMGEALVSSAEPGARTGRRRSVTFGEAPETEKLKASAQPQSQGLRKGFLGKPKPVLKKTSSISEECSLVQRSSSDRLCLQLARPIISPRAMEHTDHESASLHSLSRGESPAEWNQAREAAFSGEVVERHVGPQAGRLQHTDAINLEPPCPEGVPSVQQSGKKLSRFKQQRQTG